VAAGSSVWHADVTTHVHFIYQNKGTSLPCYWRRFCSLRAASREVVGLVVLVAAGHALQLSGVVIFEQVFHLFVRHLVRHYRRCELTPELVLLWGRVLLFLLYSRLLVLVWLITSHELLILFILPKGFLLLLFMLIQLLEALLVA